jgi:hypothetical protein
MTVPQRAMAAAKLFEDWKRENPKMTLMDAAKATGIGQGDIGLARMILRYCPESVPDIESGAKTLLDLEEIAQRRYKASRKPMERPIGVRRGQTSQHAVPYFSLCRSQLIRQTGTDVSADLSSEALAKEEVPARRRRPSLP